MLPIINTKTKLPSVYDRWKSYYSNYMLKNFTKLYDFPYISKKLSEKRNQNDWRDKINKHIVDKTLANKARNNQGGVIVLFKFTNWLNRAVVTVRSLSPGHTI